MPNNKNAMTRFKILDDLLSDRYHSYTIGEIVEELNRRLAELDPDTDGVGMRMVQKDIKYIELDGPFLAEIERFSVPYYDEEKQRKRTKRCLRYASPTFSIFKKEMSEDEKYLLDGALSLVGQFEGLPGLEGLENLQRKEGVEDDKRHIVSFTRNPLQNSTLFGQLFLAIANRQTISLTYHKFISKDKDLVISLFPYLLKEYNRRWFLFAGSEDDDKLLCFALDRIKGVEPLPAHKYKNYAGDINEAFEDIIGVTINLESPVYDICFWVSDISVDYVLTKPLHDSQRNVSGKKEENLRKQFPKLLGGRFFRIECRENYELIRELMSFGKELVVVSPDCIRKKIHQRIAEMREIYDEAFSRK